MPQQQQHADEGERQGSSRLFMFPRIEDVFTSDPHHPADFYSAAHAWEDMQDIPADGSHDDENENKMVVDGGILEQEHQQDHQDFFPRLRPSSSSPRRLREPPSSRHHSNTPPPPSTPPASTPDRFLGLLLLGDSSPSGGSLDSPPQAGAVGVAGAASSLSRRLSAAAAALEALLLEEIREARRRRDQERSTKKRRPRHSSSKKREAKRRRRRERRAVGYAADVSDVGGAAAHQDTALRTWREASSSAVSSTFCSPSKMAGKRKNGVEVTTAGERQRFSSPREDEQREDDDSESAAQLRPPAAGIFLNVPKRRRKHSHSNRRSAKKANEERGGQSSFATVPARSDIIADIRPGQANQPLPPPLPSNLSVPSAYFYGSGSGSGSAGSSTVIHPEIDLSLVRHLTAGSHLPGGFMETVRGGGGGANDLAAPAAQFDPFRSNQVGDGNNNNNNNIAAAAAPLLPVLGDNNGEFRYSDAGVAGSSIGGGGDGQSISTFDADGYGRVVTPSVSSLEEGGPVRMSYPVSLDEALAFSDRARLIIEADPPHNVAHFNAAYMGLVQASSSSSPDGGAAKLAPSRPCVVGYPLPKVRDCAGDDADDEDLTETDEEEPSSSQKENEAAAGATAMAKSSDSIIMDLVAQHVVAPIVANDAAAAAGNSGSEGSEGGLRAVGSKNGESGSGAAAAAKTVAVAVVHPIRRDGAPSMGSPWLRAGGLSVGGGGAGATHYLVEFVADGGEGSPAKLKMLGDDAAATADPLVTRFPVASAARPRAAHAVG